MPNEKSNGKNKAKLNRFTERVLMINLPTAACLLLLVMINELRPVVAVITFGTIVMVAILIIIPFMEQLQSVSDYSRSLIRSLEEGEELPTYKGELLEDEYSDIIEAINRLHNIWSAKQGVAGEKYLSDSAILDVLPDPLLLLGGKTEIVGANLEARVLFGFNTHSKPLKDIIKNSNVIKAAENIIGGYSEKETLEFETESSPSKVLLLKIERLPALAHGGAIAALVFHDVTEAKKLEQMQSDFVANASHELRTPLSVISGFIETLQGPAKNDEQARNKFLTIMSEQAFRMSRLIENLLSLSRIQMQINPPSEDVDLKELITGIALTLDTKLKQSDMSIDMNIRHNPHVLGNPAELSQVFNNLIDNAIKYGKKGTVITISSSPAEREETGEAMLAIAVNNKGDLISKDQIPRIWERFYRIDTETTRNRSGSGLGLAIVERILNHHKGWGAVTSSQSEGTTFTVAFPLYKENKDTNISYS